MLIKKNAFKCFILTIIFGMYSITVYAENQEVPLTIWAKLLSIGKWVIIFKCAYDVICSHLKGDKKGLGSAVFLGIAAYATIRYLPPIFAWIEKLSK